MRLTAAALVVLALVPATAAAAPGDPDPAFDGDGYATAAPGSTASLGALALAGDRIVGAGSSRGVCDDVTFAFWRADGTLDPGVGTGGLVVAPYEPCSEHFPHEMRVASLAVAPGGRLVTGGHWARGRGDGALVAAHHADGSPDPGFDGDGFVLEEGRGRVRAVVPLADGRIVAGGDTYDLGRTRWEVRRYLAGGAPDTSFSDDGVAEYPWVAGGFGDLLEALVPDGADGALVAAGSAQRDQGASGVVIGRIRADGSLDPAFGTGGRTRVEPRSGSESGSALARTPDGGYVVAGSSPAGWLLYKFDASGALDQTFGTAGRVDGPAGTAHAIALDPAGRLLVAGERSDGTLIVARHLADGAIDGLFGDGGIATVDFPGDTVAADDAARLTDVVVQPDGRILVGGTIVTGTRSTMALARLLGGDGDPGQASTDGEIGGPQPGGPARPQPLPAPPPPRGAALSRQAGRVSIRIVSSRVTRRGVLVRARWPRGTDGTARARLWTRNKGILLGERTVLARPGTIGRTFRVPLNRRARRLLRGGKRLKVTATLRVTGLPARR